MSKITKLIAIGNSRGIRIPQQLLEELDLNGRVKLEVKGDSLIVTPITDVNQRADWEAAFSAASQNTNEHDQLDEIKDHSWDEQEWEW